MKNQKNCFGILLILFMGTISAAPPYNVIMISIDDFNDWSGYLQGHPQARTPNIDALANQSVRFTQAYANSPSCNPSRASLLMGKHPNSTGVYSNQYPGTSTTIDIRNHYPNAVTLPQHFAGQGYDTYRIGKIFHNWADWDTVNGIRKDLSFKYSFTGNSNIDATSAWPLSGIDFIHPYCDWGAFSQPYSDFGEYSRASIAIQKLNEAHTKPFFIATGFYLPHLPWYYPKDILNEPGLSHIKNLENVLLPNLLTGDQMDLPTVAKELANSADSKPKSLDGTVSYNSWHHAITANGKWKEAVQAYLASIYFVDMQVGRILTALNSSPYANNTVVVLWSDHGWLHGQKEAWSKYKPWQQSVRTHMIIKAPGLAPVSINKPVSLIDIYPTICDLAGIPLKSDLDGRNLSPLLKNPTMAWDYPVVTAHQDARGGWQSVRNERYTYIRYYTGNNEEELYDRSGDALEWNNLAGNSSYATIKAQLRAYTPNAMTPVGSWIPAPSSNIPPNVSLTSPINGSTYTAPASVSLTASATDADGSIAKVEFFQGQTKIGEDLSAPYNLVWSGVNTGSYLLSAVATDNQGSTHTSSSISVNVNGVSPNLILNSDFSSTTLSPWIFTATSPSTGTGKIVSGQFYADITKDGGINWHIQLKQSALRLEKGKSYTLSFKAKAQSSRNIAIQIKDGAGLGATYQNKAVTSTLTSYTITFTNTLETASNYQLMFFLGAGGVNDVWLDDIQLKAN